MDEVSARAWIAALPDVPRETLSRLEHLEVLIREENARQNLVAAASLDHIWSRHIVDSAQLVQFAPASSASWIDLGSGAGFPGLVVAALHEGPVTLVEARSLRADFLQRAARELGLDVEIIQDRVERLTGRHFAVISARAFAPMARLLDLAIGLARQDTIWILPKGRNAQTELATIDPSWQGEFRLEPSLTDPQARIIVATRVARRPGRKKR
jgi:16S rRNA (guanine527-N7)-methyltransferase